MIEIFPLVKHNYFLEDWLENILMLLDIVSFWLYQLSVYFGKPAYELCCI